MIKYSKYTAQTYLSDSDRAEFDSQIQPTLKKLWQWLKPWRWLFSLTFIVSLAAAGLAVLPTILSGAIVDKGLIAGDFNILIKLVGLSVVILLLSNALDMLEAFLNTWVAQKITLDIRQKLFQHFQKLSIRYFISQKRGDIITRMTSDIDGIERALSSTFANMITQITTICISLVAICKLNIWLAIICILLLPIMIIPMRKAGKSRWEKTKESRIHQDRINQILEETMSPSGHLLSQMFARQNYEYNNFSISASEMTKLNIQEALSGRWFRAATNIFTNIGPLILYLAGGFLLIHYSSTGLTVGNILVLVALLPRLYRPVNQLLNLHVEIIRSLAIFYRVFECFDIPIEIENPPNPIIPATLAGQITFQNVSFFYNSDRIILDTINFDIQPGQSIALVGSSGAGKTSLIQLIPRLYDTTSGSILLDGIDIKMLDLSWLRKNIGFVTQDTWLFNGTIKENLLYAKPNASDQELLAVCQQAALQPLLDRCPLGLLTQVGNRGLQLSGGEKQRLSIARVLLCQPALLIFDEATSALDSVSEKLIQDAIHPLLKNRTSIIIAHRLSTIINADTIFVMDKGQIIESGTHTQLLAKKGFYAHFYDMQNLPKEQ